jgi:hypothetical protein
MLAEADCCVYKHTHTFHVVVVVSSRLVLSAYGSEECIVRIQGHNIFFYFAFCFALFTAAVAYVLLIDLFAVFYFNFFNFYMQFEK